VSRTDVALALLTIARSAMRLGVMGSVAPSTMARTAHADADRSNEALARRLISASRRSPARRMLM
jgi:hypothetical protein